MNICSETNVVLLIDLCLECSKWNDPLALGPWFIRFCISFRTPFLHILRVNSEAFSFPWKKHQRCVLRVKAPIHLRQPFAKLWVTSSLQNLRCQRRVEGKGVRLEFLFCKTFAHPFADLPIESERGSNHHMFQYSFLHLNPAKLAIKNHSPVIITD